MQIKRLDLVEDLHNCNTERQLVGCVQRQNMLYLASAAYIEAYTAEMYCSVQAECLNLWIVKLKGCEGLSVCRHKVPMAIEALG